VAAELGLVGFAAFVGAFLVTAVEVIRLRRRARIRGDPVSRELSGMADAMGAVIVGAAVAGTFLSQAYGCILWGIMGLTLAVFKVAESAAVPVESSVYAAVPGRGPWLRPSVLYDPRAASPHPGTVPGR